MEVERQLQEAVMAELDLSEEISDEELLARIDRVLVRQSKQRFLSVGQRAACRKRIFDSFRRLDILQELVEDPSITEIMVNGTEAVFLEREGKVRCWNRRFSSAEKLEDVIQQIVSKVNRTVNTSSPIVDARLEDGSRVHVVLPPVAPDGPILTIRKFPGDPVTMEKLLEWGSLTGEAARFLQRLVEARYNLFVSGGTGSGKTTFLNALSQFIPGTERVITIEDSAELQLRGIANLVRLEARNANLEGENEVSIRDLIRASLRMRPDRILVGEVRGPEALDMLQAMNTGHDGSLSTGHGNSPKDMISRLETMVLMGGDLPVSAVRGQIISALDVMVHLGRMRDGSRKVLEITEVREDEEGRISWNPLYSYQREKGRLEQVGELCSRQKLEAAGLSDI
ncbi:CpaF family protein [Cuneatibacter sp. NSJ-177]|uniref:CpaF family protein n=1 Tax=Cuneatibacter sp. NSJ-177 TaxID=2931401 RepID=UPI001FD19731|nr:CpaF family protein [Cuneatibacter sp. NSJ-177]MCJ7834956.1 CpaF family protein [Cuneatibacter sp. NSJ-177]